MALIDLPAVLTYVLKQTGDDGKEPLFGCEETELSPLLFSNLLPLFYVGYDSLSYVAFSQGTALGFACFSLMPDIASKVSNSFHLFWL